MADPRIEKRDAFLAAVAAEPVVMGILNVTPDSFSDGGRHQGSEAALAGATRMQAEGAAIIDIGAESTRPGATPLSEEEERARLAPLLKPVCDGLEIAVSLDTYKAGIAREAAARGVAVINDIWGLQGDPDMAHVTADSGCALVAMHNRAETDPGIDILGDILGFFERSLRLARRAGLPESHVLLDPGFGFGKTMEQNFAVLDGFDRLAAFGRPLLMGLSRKRMIGAATGAEVADRLHGTLAANMLGLTRGARVLRVHDVRPHRDAIRIFTATKAVK